MSFLKGLLYEDSVGALAIPYSNRMPSFNVNTNLIPILPFLSTPYSIYL